MILRTAFSIWLICFSAQFGMSQNFEISSNLCDSLSPDEYFVHVSGFATYKDSMTLHVTLTNMDSTSMGALAYEGYKDFSASGSSTLTDFRYDPMSEAFSLNIGQFTHRMFMLRIWVEVNGALTEELLIDIN